LPDINLSINWKLPDKNFKD